MFDFMKSVIASGQILMASTAILTEEQARELNMYEVITNDPDDGSITSYLISDKEGISHAENLLVDGLNLYNTPMAMWAK